MATVRDIDIIFSTAERQGLKFYEVLDAQNNKLFYNNDEEKPLDKALAELRSDLNSVDGLVTIKLRGFKGGANTKGTSVRDQVTFTIRLGNESGINGIKTPPQQGAILDFASFEQRMNEREEALRREFRYENQIADLKRQLAELKTADPWEKHIGSLMPMLINKLTGSRTTGIAGIPTEPTEPTEQIDQVKNDRVTHAVQRLWAIDENIADNLEKLADLATNNKAMYDMAVQTLNNMSNG